jgi:hypothetical protein
MVTGMLLAALGAGLPAGAAAQDAAPARTRVVLWAGEPVAVSLAAGRTTALALPAPITSVVTTASKDALSIETAGSRLYLSPLTPDWAGELFVVLADDSQVPVLAAVGPTPDLIVKVVRKPAQAAAPPNAEGAGTPRWSPLRLLRAMMLRSQGPGLTVAAEAARTVVYDDSVLTLRLLERWRTPRLEGLVLEAENRSALWVRVALESLAFDGLLAVGADRDSLAPQPTSAEQALAGHHRTRLYLVRTPEGRR